MRERRLRKSRKTSARTSRRFGRSSSSSRRPELPPVILDENLAGKVIPAGLRALGLEVLLLQDVAPAGTPDVDWLSRVGKEGWLLVSKDDRIRRRMNERIALREAAVRAVFYEDAEMTARQMVDAFEKGLSALGRLVRRLDPPYVLRLGPTGRVRRIF